mmetsp:Transcript_15421/g.41749  ORF Transcript_15421/g.41749 Transcript_15421/m.41749 type:complete len:236 (+) Transcript_15421:1230-1937(+)
MLQFLHQRHGAVLCLCQPKAAELGAGAGNHGPHQLAWVDLEALKDGLLQHGIDFVLGYVGEQHILLTGQAHCAITIGLSNTGKLVEVAGQEAARGNAGAHPAQAWLLLVVHAEHIPPLPVTLMVDLDSRAQLDAPHVLFNQLLPPVLAQSLHQPNHARLLAVLSRTKVPEDLQQRLIKGYHLVVGDANIGGHRHDVTLNGEVATHHQVVHHLVQLGVVNRLKANVVDLGVGEIIA